MEDKRIAYVYTAVVQYHPNVNAQTEELILSLHQDVSAGS